jgi:hypothetical protein
MRGPGLLTIVCRPTLQLSESMFAEGDSALKVLAMGSVCRCELKFEKELALEGIVASLSNILLPTTGQDMPRSARLVFVGSRLSGATLPHLLHTRWFTIP